jgi:N6-L-threonylcarbamoyladenine synthase
MRILAIESSCDETAAAVLESQNGKITILSETKATSEETHKRTKGVVPELAAREQIVSIIPVIDKAISDSGLKLLEIDVVAVTVGPGLIGSLLVGVETAKSIALAIKKPLIGVNHLVGHLYSGWIDGEPIFPVLGMVVSGGHTDMVLMDDYGKIRWLGGTVDDAAGECFDKCARVVLGASYPGGPAISTAAEKFESLKKQSKISLPRPMINSGDYNFSFSGLKTAVVNEVKNQKSEIRNQDYKNELAAELQEAVVDVLITKLKAAINEYSPVSVVVGGGVTANKLFREELLKLEGVKLFLPKLKHTGDNATMIGAATLHFDWSKLSKFFVESIIKTKADPGLGIA